MDRPIYFLKIAGKNCGPFSANQLRELSAGGSISLTSETWTATSNEQVTVKEIIFPVTPSPESESKS